ncbi:MAG TPA: thiamine pyrophosphate-binding protein [Candidatus Acidoferrum sp.]|jgi:acetolactate synthase-1/2/3 large subunit|nr:thiamine pyrophosphate-binding protein [Candidatus Acidoferrum sp.]
MAKVTGGELVVRTLMKAGVTNIFGLHGAHLETIFQSCLDHKIPVTDTRHEVAAGHAAEGYARSTRGLGVAMVTAGPGFTNVITSLANAYLDRTPVLYITGSSGLSEAETNTLQSGLDQVAIATPITKWAHRVTVTQNLPRLVAQAVRMTTSAPTGPVLLDLPIDVLMTQVDEESAPIPENLQLDSPAPPQPRAVDEAMALLKAAQRPLIMAGVGAYFAGAGEELRAFAEASGIPVFSDFQAHGLLPSDHPLYGGTYHKMADLSAPEQRPDVVLALGVRFGLFTLGMNDLVVPLAAKIIHVEVDAKEIGRLRQAAVAIVADSRETLHALNARAKSEKWPDRGKWQQAVRNAKVERCKRMQEDLNRTAPPIHPLQAVSAIVDSMPEDTIVIGDGAEAYHWMNEVIRQNKPGGYITHGFLGAVGMGLGLSLGAQVANPKRPVLCLVGDGAIGFTIAEFDTMARHKLPIVAVVMNNHSWAASQHFQEIVSGKNRLLGTELRDANYHEVAQAFGCFGRRVTKIEELGPVIKEAFASGKPACVNVSIDVAPIPPEVHLLMSRH